jgi:hypothetical protein
MDLTIGWTWQGLDNLLTPDSYAVSVGGALHGGNNIDSFTMYELAFFQTGSAPPPTTYHVCAGWATTETPTMRVIGTVFRGYAVATSSKTIDTTSSLAYDTPCNPSSPGYILSYSLANGTAPPLVASSPPPPLSYPSSFQLVFRADWRVLGGVLGESVRRETRSSAPPALAT